MSVAAKTWDVVSRLIFYTVLFFSFVPPVLRDVVRSFYPNGGIPLLLRYVLASLLTGTYVLSYTMMSLFCLYPPVMDAFLVVMRVIALNHPLMRFGNVCYPGAPQPSLVANWSFDPSYLMVVMYGPAALVNRTGL
jgi:hypothetical protein